MDNVKARELTSLGTYVKKGKNGRDKIGVQQYYIDHPIRFAKSEIQKNGFLWRLERLLARVKGLNREAPAALYRSEKAFLHKSKRAFSMFILSG